MKLAGRIPLTECMKTSRDVVFLCALLSIGALGAAADIESDLYAYWRFEDSLNDTAGWFNGRPHGACPIEFVEGKFGKALFLDGVDQFVEIVGGDESDFDFLESDFTVSAWCRAASVENDSSEVIAKGYGDTWRIGRWVDAPGFTLIAGSAFKQDRTIDVRDDFHHLVIVRDSRREEVRFYFDGGEEAVPFCAMGENAGRVRIGGGTTMRTAGEWHGWIDDIAVWKRALSKEDVAVLWNEGAGTEVHKVLVDGDQDGMVDFWELSHGLDPTVNDSAIDSDLDGLTNAREFELKTDPRSEDSDGDGLSDLVETRTGIWLSEVDRGTDPNKGDSDSDGLSDGMEMPPAGTNPNLPDTDGDGFTDAQERLGHADGLDAENHPTMEFGLISYWPFDGSLADKIVPSRNVEPHPIGVVPRFVSGKYGDALKLSGNGDFVQVEDVDSEYDFRTASGFSISCWVNASRGSDVLMVNGTPHSWALWTNDFGDVIFVSGIEKSSAHEDPVRGCETYYGASAVEGTSLLGSKLRHLVVTHNNLGQISRYFLDGREIVRENVGANRGSFDSTHPGLLIGSRFPDDLETWQGTLDDLAIWSRPLTEREVMAIWNDGDGKSIGRLTDTADLDEDGMLDAWEVEQQLDVSVDDSADDPDGDGATNLEEYLADTDARNPDTDDDGLMDGVESKTGIWRSVADTGTHPRKLDSDGDGLSDGVENPDGEHVDASQSASDPNTIDTDGDGHTDDAEARFGSHPAVAGSIPGIGAGLSGYWGFDGDFKGKTLGAEPLNGQPEGDVQFAEGRFGEAVQLTGEGAIVMDEQSVELFDFVGESFSVGLWVRLDPSEFEGNSKADALIGKGLTGSWYFERRGFDLQFQPGLPIAISAGWNPPGLDDGRLYHVVGVVDAARRLAELYLDGEKVDPFENYFYRDASPSVSGSRYPLVIGNNPVASAVNGWSGLIDDVSIWSRALTERDVQELYKSGLSVGELAFASDDDHDGMNDLWEERTGLNSGLNDADSDPDADGLTNIEEFVLRADPLNSDSDSDGLLDGAESGTGVWVSDGDTGTDVLKPDTDGDGLLDGDETPDTAFAAGQSSGTNPNDSDSDGDGYSDLEEFRYGIDPTSAASVPGTSDGLVGYWSFDGNLRDSSGVRHGTAEGRTPIAFGPGQFDGAMMLDGQDQFVRVGEGGADDLVGKAFDFVHQDMTVSAWFSIPTGLQKYQTLVSDGWSIRQAGYNLVSFGAGLPESFEGPGVNDGKFHHFVGVHRFGRDARHYIDGSLVDVVEGYSYLEENEFPLAIGVKHVRAFDGGMAKVFYWNGTIDDVAIWDRALRENEISAIWADGRGRSIGALTGLAAPFEIIAVETSRSDPGRNEFETTIRWNSRPGRAYSVDVSFDLERWEELVDGYESQGMATEYFHVHEMDVAPELYYRIRELEAEL